MAKDVQINKVVRQHMDMDEFFSGGFTVKIEKKLFAQAKPASPETIKQLEAIADEVRRCDKCQLCSTRKNAVPG